MGSPENSKALAELGLVQQEVQVPLWPRLWWLTKPRFPVSLCIWAPQKQWSSGLLQPGYGCMGLAFYSCYILGPHYLL